MTRVWLNLSCCAVLIAGAASSPWLSADDELPSPIVSEVDDSGASSDTPLDDSWPLPPPEPRQLPARATYPSPPPPVSPPLNLNPQSGDLVAEVRILAAAKRFDEALSLLRSYRQRHPHDEEARRLEVAIEVAHNEHRMRALIMDQQQERMTVLADPHYLIAKAAAERSVVRRLDLVEVLVEQQRFPEAVNACNAILEDYPYDEAVMSLKNAILRTMIEIERRRAMNDRHVRHSEVIKDVIKRGTMPRQPAPIPRQVLVFDEDIAEMERQRVRDRLTIRLDAISYENAPVGEVLRLLFAAAGMNYIILDEAISEQTVTMFLTDAPVSEVLAVLQNMVDVRFNYRGGTVYITNSTTPILVTEIIRLASGLTNVQMESTLEPMSGMEGNGGGSSTPSPFGSEGETNLSDLERFLERIPELVDWPEGSTYFVERKSNTLYVRSSPSTVAEIKRLIHALDFNNTQVLIEAKFVEVEENALHELGVDWTIGGFQTSGSQGVIAGGATRGTGNLSAGIADQLPGPGGLFSNLGVLTNPGLGQAAGGALESGLGAVASPGLNVGFIGAGSGMNPNFEARLRALESRGKANTLSEPKILTLSNSTGVIEISRDRAFVESVRNIGTGSRTAERDESGNFITTGSNVIEPVYGSEREGIRLRVVPSVARNSDIVTLAVFPTIKQFAGFPNPVGTDNPDTGTSTIIQRPQFSYRQLATALHVKNGQTVVLGGLITEESSESRSGIPLLSRIPFAGRLFSSESKTNVRRKLLIFVTARIIDPSGAELGEEERWLRDTARVVLPAEVQRQLRQQERERQEEIERALEEQKEEEEADPQPRRRPGDFRSRLQGGR